MKRQLAKLASLTVATTMAAACTSGPPNEAISYRTALVQYESCAALEADLKQLFIEELETYFEPGYWGNFPEDDTAPPEAGEPSGGRAEGTDYSGTNNQEDGVDEADFVKTDGYHVYVLNGNRFHIFGVPEFGELIPQSEFELEGYPTQMLVNSEANRAVIFSNIWVWTLPDDHPLRARVGHQENDGWHWRSSQLTKVTVLDITDRGEPGLVRELFMEGSYNTARMVDSSVRMAAYSWLNIPGLIDWHWYWRHDALEESKRRAIQRIRALELADMVPTIYERLPSGEVTPYPLTRNECRSFYRPQNSRGRGYTSILSLNVLSNTLSFDADHVLTNYPTLYSSRDYMYIAESSHDWWWFWSNDEHPEQVNLHKFDIRRPGRSVYKGSGRVLGSINNQFALSEHDGYLRVATTTDRWQRWWLEDPPVSENHLHVLELQGDELVTVGHLGGIAPGESIFASRMIGDKGYLVTFEMIDPLFTIDLSDPTNPTLIGELEIPGFSTYIHPLAEDKLLTIGVGGDETGANWRTQVSMFDVSDFAAPALFDVEALVMPDGWGWSEALYEHKAFQYWAPKNLLAVPLSTYSYDPATGWYDYTSALELLTVNLQDGLSRYGSIDHSSLYNTDRESYWWYRDVRRSIFMGDYIYAISDRGLTVHHLDDLETPVAQHLLPGYTPDNWYWWW